MKPTANKAPRAENKAPRAERPARQMPVFALSMDEAARALGVSTPVTYSLVERGLLRTFVIGRRRLTTPQALTEAVAALEAAGGPMPAETPHNRRATVAA